MTATTGGLSGRIALVTGAGSGLGAAIARRLSADGAFVVVNDIDAEAAHAVAESVGGEASVFDVSRSETFDAAVDQIVARHGRIDILVNNAGIAPPNDPAQTERGILNQIARAEGRLDALVPPDIVVGMTDGEWDRMIKVHLYGAFHGVRAALRHMTPARSGAIVNISSVLALRPAPSAVHYAVAKAGILALTKATGQEVAAFGVRINAICPGWIDTPLLHSIDPIVMSAIVSQVPAGRMAEADEIANAVRYLVGPESSYCTGDVITVSGGVAP